MHISKITSAMLAFMLMLHLACDKNEDNTPEPNPKTPTPTAPNNIVLPKCYAPYFPGSYWEYNNISINYKFGGNTDTTYRTSIRRMDTGYHEVLVNLNGVQKLEKLPRYLDVSRYVYIREYEEAIDPENGSALEFYPFLGLDRTKNYFDMIRREGKITDSNMTLAVGDTVFTDVIKWTVFDLGGNLGSSSSHFYYAKNVGLVKTWSSSNHFGGPYLSTDYITELIDYEIK